MSNETENKHEKRGAARIASSDLLAFIRELPDASDYIFEDEDGRWVTQEWLCGTFAGRGFVAETYEAACDEMIEYLYRHIGHESMVGRSVDSSGWPDMKRVREYVMSGYEAEERESSF